VEAPGVALRWQEFQELVRERAFLVKLLITGAFDVFINSTGLRRDVPESTRFVEALWRRREPVLDDWAPGPVPVASKEA
jgi:hypothetical protein